MLGWLNTLRRTPAPPVPVAAPPRAEATPAARPPAADEPAPQPASALSWLLECPLPLQSQLTEAELALVRDLDHQLAAAALPADLIPRAASVLPQVLAMLRQPLSTRAAMVQQVLKDTLLTTEVLRLARSPYYGTQPVETLEEAIERIGTSGLQSAMCRVLLKPVFFVQTTGPAARAVPRIWERAEYKSLLCAGLVAREGGERLDGFLAGLLHDVGWLALLRLLDRMGRHPEVPLSQALDLALERRKDRLFGRLAVGWNLGPVLTELAQHLARGGPNASGLPLATALTAADHQCTADLCRMPESG